MAQWSPSGIVVVLGAGATRGASFVKPGFGCQPPLNADFFTQLQRVVAAKHQGVVTEVLRDVVALYGSNFDLTLEQYFTQLETLIEMTKLVDLKKPKYSESRLEGMRRRLLNAVSAVLEESADVTKRSSKARLEPCEHHKALAEALHARDTIISFNYDCVVDHALRTYGAGKWSARYGYGFSPPDHVEGHELWSASDAPLGENSSINLLKLHGSLNFFPFPSDEGEPIRLRERPYRQTGKEVYEIIPPELAKRIGDRPVFSTLWRRAERAIRLATRVVLIGFSFTPTDTHVDSFFRMALAGNKKLERLIIANPSKSDRYRIRSVFASKLGGGRAQVVQYDRFEHLAPDLDALLHE
jgi:hypothetical protein